jgi:hypothetical protein
LCARFDEEATMEVSMDSTGEEETRRRTSDAIVHTRPGPCRSGRAMVLGATLALGGCTFAACTDDADFEPKMPSIAATTSAPETAYEEPNEPDVTATHARLDQLDASPGFVPDPMLEHGLTGGGAVDLEAFDDRCRGWTSRDPDFVVEADRPFAELSLMVKADEDTTLLVIGSDGETRCGDDEDASHPVVRGPFAAGRIRVWVGTERRGAEIPFVLGLSELDDSLPSGL